MNRQTKRPEFFKLSHVLTSAIHRQQQGAVSVSKAVGSHIVLLTLSYHRDRTVTHFPDEEDSVSVFYLWLVQRGLFAQSQWTQKVGQHSL